MCLCLRIVSRGPGAKWKEFSKFVGKKDTRGSRGPRWMRTRGELANIYANKSHRWLWERDQDVVVLVSSRSPDKIPWLGGFNDWLDSWWGLPFWLTDSHLLTVLSHGMVRGGGWISDSSYKSSNPGASLVFPWLRIRPAMQGTRVPSLVQEDTMRQLSPCPTAAEPMPRNKSSPHSPRLEKAHT